MESLISACFPCCSGFEDYTKQAMDLINKSLGNIMKSHPDICFLGLLNSKNGQAKLVHYLATEKLYADVDVPRDDMDLAEIHQDHYFNKKLEKAQREKLRQKTEKIIEAVLQLKQT